MIYEQQNTTQQEEVQTTATQDKQMNLTNSIKNEKPDTREYILHDSIYEMKSTEAECATPKYPSLT